MSKGTTVTEENESEHLARLQKSLRESLRLADAVGQQQQESQQDWRSEVRHRSQSPAARIATPEAAQLSESPHPGPVDQFEMPNHSAHPNFERYSGVGLDTQRADEIIATMTADTPAPRQVLVSRYSRESVVDPRTVSPVPNKVERRDTDEILAHVDRSLPMDWQDLPSNPNAQERISPAMVELSRVLDEELRARSVPAPIILWADDMS